MRRRRFFLWILLSVAMLASTAVASAAQEALVPRENHEWGRFHKGAWKRVRVVTEMLGADGAVVGTTTTETTTTLLGATDRTATLQIDTTVEIAGKRFDKQPRIVEQDYSGHAKVDKATVKVLGEGSVEIDGRKIPTTVRQITIGSGDAAWESKIDYSSRVAPYVLRRKTVSTDPEDKAANYETTVAVVALNMPYKVLAEIKTASYVKTIHRSAAGTTVTLEVRCEDVPGGVVSHTSKRLDADGKLVSHSTLELLDYGMEEDRSGRRGIFRRDRDRRGRSMNESDSKNFRNAAFWLELVLPRQEQADHKGTPKR